MSRQNIILKLNTITFWFCYTELHINFGLNILVMWLMVHVSIKLRFFHIIVITYWSRFTMALKKLSETIKNMKSKIAHILLVHLELIKCLSLISFWLYNTEIIIHHLDKIFMKKAMVEHRQFRCLYRVKIRFLGFNRRVCKINSTKKITDEQRFLKRFRHFENWILNKIRIEQKYQQ